MHSLDAGFRSGGHGNTGTKQLRSIVLSLMLNLLHFYGMCLFVCGQIGFVLSPIFPTLFEFIIFFYVKDSGPVLLITVATLRAAALLSTQKVCERQSLMHALVLQQTKTWQALEYICIHFPRFCTVSKRKCLISGKKEVELEAMICVG